MNTKAHRFCLTASRSPTYYNLCHHLRQKNWHFTRFYWRAHFSECHFQFNLACAQTLEFKHLLAQLVAQHCPHVMPLTYCINDENWPVVLQKIAAQHVDQLTWILKPALLNNGQHIKIFQNLHQIEQHYCNMQRLGGEHVLQHYVSNIHLLQGPKEGHKYSLRMFVILTNDAGAYLYPHGYYNIALQAYQEKDFRDVRSHLTNEYLIGSEINVVQIPTQQYDLFQSLYPKIKKNITSIIKAVKQQHPQVYNNIRKRTLAIFGFDFIVDSDQNVWLLEANHAPCFPTQDTHPLQKPLYEPFWRAIIDSFVIPIATHQPIDVGAPPLFDWVG